MTASTKSGSEMAMQFFTSDGRPIRTLAEWPRRARHWALGRSAMELARDWLEGDAAERVRTLLERRSELADLTLQTGVVEKLTRFDDIRGGPRNHDLLVHASARSGAVVIGVEGKADESFDLTLRGYVDRAGGSD